MKVLSRMLEGGYESLHLFSDAATGLRGFVALHSTVLGPGLGGTRALTAYRDEEEAAVDALRLAKGMTYKAAMAGLPLGGGKAVIMLPGGAFNRSQLFEAFGRGVNSLGGRYVTTEDSGTSPDDMVAISRATKHVVGLPGHSGDPSPVTAYGVVRGIEATQRHLHGTDDLKGVRVNVLGVGHVGRALVDELRQRGARVCVADARVDRAEEAAKAFGAEVLSIEALLRHEADFYAPCALGGAINDETLPLLKVKAVAGAANNQLLEPRHGQALVDRGILYVPDYVINAGGLINVAQELEGYDREKAMGRASRIYDTVLALLDRARSEGRRPEQVADTTVDELLAKRRRG